MTVSIGGLCDAPRLLRPSSSPSTRLARIARSPRHPSAAALRHPPPFLAKSSAHSPTRDAPRLASPRVWAVLAGQEPRSPGPSASVSQNWNLFLKNDAKDSWACALLPVSDRFFRAAYLFFILELSLRRVVQFGVTRHPTNVWVARQRREATPYFQAPRFWIHDNACQFGAACSARAQAARIAVLCTPYRAPRANALCERFLGSVRGERLAHLLSVSDAQLHQVIGEWFAVCNTARPHQGIRQQIPDRRESRARKNVRGSLSSFRCETAYSTTTAEPPNRCSLQGGTADGFLAQHSWRKRECRLELVSMTHFFACNAQGECRLSFLSG